MTSTDNRSTISSEVKGLEDNGQFNNSYGGIVAG